jgi:tRNA(Ile)-lysidine synthase TilS/MesJ
MNQGINNKIMAIHWNKYNNNNNKNKNNNTFPNLKPSTLPNYPTISQLETTARIERYKLLAKLCKESNIKLLFLGHHLNDQLETMIMRFSRGSGIDGLAGMDVISRFPIIQNHEALDINIVRPLLSITKVPFFFSIDYNIINK